MNYILDEKNFIRQIIASKHKPDDVSMNYLITMIAKYYYDNDISVDLLINKVKECLLSLDIPCYQEYVFYKTITKICNEIMYDETKRSFKDLQYIPIYQSEIDFISTLDNDREKKLYFTLITIARYMNCNGWINKKTPNDLNEVFKLANVNLKDDQKSAIIHKFLSNGIITMAKQIDNLNICVPLQDDGDIAYKVTSFDKIGNQYIGNFKLGRALCKGCGKTIKYTVHNKMYCPKCAENINREQTKNRMKNLRNGNMFEASKFVIP